MKTAEMVALEAIYKSMDAELERQNRFLGTQIKSTRLLTMETHTMTTGDKAKLISAESQAALKEYKTWKYFQERADKAIEAYERLMCLVPKEDVAIMVVLTMLGVLNVYLKMILKLS